MKNGGYDVTNYSRDGSLVGELILGAACDVTNYDRDVISHFL